MKRKRNETLAPCALALAVSGAAAALLAAPAAAFELYANDGDSLSFDGIAMFGLFDSQRSYNLGAKTEGGGGRWREGFINYGLTGVKALDAGAVLHGRFSLVSSGTWGDGDAGGFTSGNERRTAVEDAYLGWRSGTLFPALGEDGVDFSFGRQSVTIGDGFLINGDALNFGDAIDRVAGSDLDRGGAYWLAARKAFDGTAVLRLGGADGLRSDLFWLQSDNNVQGRMELAGINLEYVTPKGTLATTVIEGLDLDDAHADGLTHRDGQTTWSLRGQGNAGVENLFLSAEFVNQNQGDDTARDADAWYLEAGWTFGDVTWTPSINYRFSSFDEGFDPLFFGFSRGYGTWFQGEVAANFAGPFNSDAEVHYVGLRAMPRENLEVGLNIFSFRDTAGGSGALDGNEYDFFANWTVSDNLIVSPVIGFYDPDNSDANGGSQIGSRSRSTYAHLLLIVPF